MCAKKQKQKKDTAGCTCVVRKIWYTRTLNNDVLWYLDEFNVDLLIKRVAMFMRIVEFLQTLAIFVVGFVNFLLCGIIILLHVHRNASHNLHRDTLRKNAV